MNPDPHEIYDVIIGGTTSLHDALRNSFGVAVDKLALECIGPVSKAVAWNDGVAVSYTEIGPGDIVIGLGGDSGLSLASHLVRASSGCSSESNHSDCGSLGADPDRKDLVFLAEPQKQDPHIPPSTREFSQISDEGQGKIDEGLNSQTVSPVSLILDAHDQGIKTLSALDTPRKRRNRTPFRVGKVRAAVLTWKGQHGMLTLAARNIVLSGFHREKNYLGVEYAMRDPEKYHAMCPSTDQAVFEEALAVSLREAIPTNGSVQAPAVSRSSARSRAEERLKL